MHKYIHISSSHWNLHVIKPCSITVVRLSKEEMMWCKCTLYFKWEQKTTTQYFFMFQNLLKGVLKTFESQKKCTHISWKNIGVFIIVVTQEKHLERNVWQIIHREQIKASLTTTLSTRGHSCARGCMLLFMSWTHLTQRILKRRELLLLLSVVLMNYTCLRGLDSCRLSFQFSACARDPPPIWPPK